MTFLRYKRKKAETTFDRSMMGELDHAIANTNSIIHISRIMIAGYLAPMSLYLGVKMVTQGASLEKWFLIFGLYLLAFVLILWERRNMHIPRKESLLSLKRKLTEE